MTRNSQTIAVATTAEAVGDGMLKLPFVLALKAAAPDARLVWLTSGASAYQNELKDVVNGAIDEFLDLPEPSFGLGTLMGKPLIDRTFDVLIDAHEDERQADWLKKRVPHRSFVSAAKAGRLSSVPIPAEVSQSANVLKRLMGLGSAVVGRPLKQAPVVLSDAKWTDAALNLLPDGPRYVGLFPGAGDNAAAWPMERFIQIGKRLEEKGFTPVVILGPDEIDLAPVMKSSLQNAPQPLRDAPFHDVPMTVALIQRMTAALANDSGGGKIALGSGCAVACLYRQAAIRDKYLPPRANVRGFAPEDFGGQTIRSIPLDAVEKGLAELLDIPTS